MTAYKRGSQKETDAQLLYSAKEFGGNMGLDLLELIERRDKKSIAMLELLERWVKNFRVDYSYRSYDRWTQRDIINDTKTLLKEAKVE